MTLLLIIAGALVALILFGWIGSRNAHEISGDIPMSREEEALDREMRDGKRNIS